MFSEQNISYHSYNDSGRSDVLGAQVYVHIMTPVSPAVAPAVASSDNRSVETIFLAFEISVFFSSQIWAPKSWRNRVFRPLRYKASALGHS